MKDLPGSEPGERRTGVNFEHTLADIDRQFQVYDAHAALRRVLYLLDDPKDRLNWARTRGVILQMKILDTTEGEWYVLSASQVGLHLGISVEEVEKQRAENRLLALDFHTDGSIWLYPVGQFVEDGKLPGLEELLQVMAEHDPFTKTQLLLNGNSWLDGKSLAEYLREGGVLRNACHAAEMFGEQAAV
jgi:hypothetical protein